MAIRRLMPSASDTVSVRQTTRAAATRATERTFAERTGLAEGQVTQHPTDTVEVNQTSSLQSFARTLAAQTDSAAQIARLQASIENGTYQVDASGIAEKMLSDHDFASAF